MAKLRHLASFATHLLLVSPWARTAYSKCTTTQLYVDTNADENIGLQNNGASPETAFANVFDAEKYLKYFLAQGNDTTQVVINLASGVYSMISYLRLTDRHSGSAECPTIWQAPDGDAILSGGTMVTDWSPVAEMAGIYSTQVSPLSRTRALFVDGVSMPQARSAAMFQNYSTYTSVGFMNDGPGVDFTLIDKIRYTPPAWYRQQIGYDAILEGDLLGLFLENSLTFLDEDGEWYLDLESDTLYYKPVGGKDPNDPEIYLPRLELVLSIGGLTYSMPAHDMQFVNITFTHTTWNFPSSQREPLSARARTGVSLTRPHWYMTPGTVQVSAAQRISFHGGSVTMTGAAGLAVGNDDNAHVTSLGLGAQDILISGMSFTQTGGNALQVGGVGLNAHHPIIPEMVNSGIIAEYNGFDSNALIYNSGAGIGYYESPELNIQVQKMQNEILPYGKTITCKLKPQL
ncbi:hypothetical protein F5884DRAFT_743527 [Xylogone sp. PMI_703]|nr:hypothetical protein F5884DRAFT_743527 [Xylogone sp. PMI_703]